MAVTPPVVLIAQVRIQASDHLLSLIIIIVIEHSPTEEMPSATVFNPSLATPAAETLHCQCQEVSSHAHGDEGTPSPTIQRKKPIPLPRMKRRLPHDSLQVSSPTSPVPTKFIYSQQETQPPSSLVTASALGIPQSASTSCLTCSADYSGDYSGGTGDSGVGDVRHYVPSKKLLDGNF